MTSISTQKILSEATTALNEAGVENAALDARLLLAHVMGIPSDRLITHPPESLQPQDISAFDTLLARRVAREPLAYIIGKKPFWSLDFIVSPATLIPRPDSETLIETALKRIRQRSQPLEILDLGTGSGCLLLSLLSECPRAMGLGIDQSEDALAIAQQNAERLGLKQRAQFEVGNWGESILENFDIILSNPPYIKADEIDSLQPEVKYEPRAALDGAKDGLQAYREIAKGATKLLKPKGLMLLEIGSGQDKDVTSIMVEAGLTLQEKIPDLSGIIRCLVITRTTKPNRRQSD